MKPAAKDTDEYISDFPKDIQEKLHLIRRTIRQAAPDAVECINYGIPTFKIHGNLVHFAAYKTHFGFYPGASAIVEFKKELALFNTAKGTVQFPLDKPLPLKMILDIVIFRLDENMRKAKPVKKKK
ncbi:DUF1801 domain-containing protein [Aquiflexum sp. TKW24L]|uniref:iron chaperone n=1 Tax=Aquiflexum sp. TKW24L TaxID=2942212 RepID=UPI0020BE22C6|nr:DUF1801 domain-containing protein [Aquiflexum sp. TKW24L]MCL6260149.1 DUF1801 domain-containing protein [Aquiflexum sp. TKW24L]